jgi:phosphoglycerate dehydrogenase-like enzyme
MTHILITADFAPYLLDKIRAVARDVQVEQVKLTKGEWPAEASTNAEIYYATWGIPRPEQAPNLRWVQTHFAGVDHLVHHPIWHSDILLTSASGVHTSNIAQYVLAQILYWANHIERWRTAQAGGQWPENRWQTFLPIELRGKTLGIVGYGSLGREIGRLAKAFGLRVLATKGNAKQVEDVGYTLPGTGDPKGQAVERIYPPEAIRSMVAEADFVVITAPLTSKTHHLFNEELLRVMKPTAYLINVGRGSIIKEGDLVKALKKGWLAGAGLDVFEEEPLPASSPLWKLDNLLLSPHVSGFTEQYNDRTAELFAQNLRRYLAGEPLLNVVNRERGY